MFHFDESCVHEMHRICEEVGQEWVLGLSNLAFSAQRTGTVRRMILDIGRL
jgi:hypothetical protein